jgi:hypothetical protein
VITWTARRTIRTVGWCKYILADIKGYGEVPAVALIEDTGGVVAAKADGEGITWDYL